MSLYNATVPAYLQQMRALHRLVGKARDFCAAGGASEAEIQAARIADDMLPFPWQVRWGPVHSIRAIEACRRGQASPDTTPPPATFDEQEVMLADAIGALEALTRDEVDALADRTVVFSAPSAGIELAFVGSDFLLSFAVPNFYFHVTTAYNLLRARGVPIGKIDFLGSLRLKEQP